MFGGQLTGSASFAFLWSISLSQKTEESARRGNLPALPANTAVSRFVEKITNVSCSSVGHRTVRIINNIFPPLGGRGVAVATRDIT